jgi:hypothetical protein
MISPIALMSATNPMLQTIMQSSAPQPLSAMQGFGMGASVGGMMGNFYNSMQALKDQERDNRRAYETTQAQMEALLGAPRAGLSADVDRVGGYDDPRSRYLPVNTAVSSGGGMASEYGMNPYVVQARKRLYEMSTRNPYGDPFRNAMTSAAQLQMGNAMNAQTTGQTGSDLMNILKMQGGGMAAAQLGMQADAAQRAYGQQTGSAGTQFLNSLYSAARGTF